MFFVPEKFKKEEEMLNEVLIKDLEKFVEKHDYTIFRRIEVGFSFEHAPGAQNAGILLIKDKPTGEVLLGLADDLIDKFHFGSEQDNREFILYNNSGLVFTAYVMALYNGIFTKEDLVNEGA